MLPELIPAIDRFMRAHAADEPGLVEWRNGFPIPPGSPLYRRMTDFDFRLAEMDADGIDVQLLGIMSPGLQIFEPGEGTALAQMVNDRIAAIAARHPTRFASLANIAPQDPTAAAREVTRAIRTLGFNGVLVNSHTRGHFLDEPRFRPLLETIQELDVPVYIHPREPAPQMFEPYSHYGLQGAMWGYQADTSLHAMRLIASGLLDELPRLKLVIGHGGEGVPFFLDRLDSRHHAPSNRPGTVRLQLKPSDCFRRNFWVTTSGMNWAPAVTFCQEVLGPDRVLFAVDYPLEDQRATIRAADAIPMTAAARAMFYETNARELFRI